MAEVASAFVTLVPSAKGFGAGIQREIGGDLDRSGKQGGKRFGSGFAAAGMAPIRAFGVAAAGVFAAVGVAGALKGMIAEARENQKVGALTEQVIKSTGGAAKITAAQVSDLTIAIGEKSGIDDEAIASGANLLLTFKNVRNEVGKGSRIFDRATQAATDLAAAGFGDINGASKQLGKALNDPVKGMNALARSGVTFTAAQQKQIKALVKSGDLLSAQKIILGEVESQVGGAAAATATAGDKFTAAFGNFKEALGTALLPVIDSVLGAATKFTLSLTAGLLPAVERVPALIAPVVAAVRSFVAGLGGGGGLSSMVQTVGAVITGTILPALQQFGGYIITNVVPVLRSLAGIVVGSIIPGFLAVASFLAQRVFPAVVSIVLAVGSRLKPVFDQLVATFNARVLPAVTLIVGKFREWWPTIQRVILVVVQVIGWIVKLAASILGKVLPVLIRFAGFLLTVVVKAVIGVIQVVARIIGSLISFGAAVGRAAQAVGQFAQAVASKVAAIYGYFKALPARIVNALGNLGGTLRSAGVDLITGLWEGIKSMGSWLADKVTRFVSDAIPGPVKKALGISSPSKVMADDVGRWIPAGIAQGIDANASTVRASMTRLVQQVTPTTGGTVTGANAAAAGVRLHPHDIALLADAIAARPTVLDGRTVSKVQDRTLVRGITP